MLRADAFLSILLSNGEALLLEIKKLSLVFALVGQKQGKTELFTVADLRGMQENQRVSELWIDKPEFVSSLNTFYFSMVSSIFRTIRLELSAAISPKFS